MEPKRRASLPDLILGDLPVDSINKVLGLELEPGTAIFSRAAQVHAARRHPVDYPMLLPHAAAIVREPLYVGDDFRNAGKIELIGAIPGMSGFALVAIVLKPDQHGRYHVASMYTVPRSKIDARRAKGFLKVMLKR